jgi:hypothetical protein
MPSIRWVPKFGMIRWRVAVYIQPINSFEPGMSLMYVYKHIYILPIFGNLNVPTLMCSAPSTLPDEPGMTINPLRRAFTITEFGLDTEAEDCEPRRSSGSQRSCSIRLTPSWDTRGRDGKRNDCFQFKIFWRVTWRYNGKNRSRVRANGCQGRGNGSIDQRSLFNDAGKNSRSC